MKRLNRAAAALLLEAGVRACTDVTGFSLIGHGLELAEASGVRLELAWDAMPLVQGVLELASRGAFPGGTERNRAYFAPRVRFARGVGEAERRILFTPETSGGLLAAVPENQLSALRERCAREGQGLWLIGQVSAGQGIEVHETA